MAKFTTTPSGIVIPVEEPRPKPAPKPESEERDGFPVKPGWQFSMCDDRYCKSHDDDFRMKALEALYISVDPWGGGIKLPRHIEAKERCERLINELAVELVGGIPEGWEQFT